MGWKIILKYEFEIEKEFVIWNWILKSKPRMNSRYNNIEIQIWGIDLRDYWEKWKQIYRMEIDSKLKIDFKSEIEFKNWKWI